MLVGFREQAEEEGEHHACAGGRVGGKAGLDPLDSGDRVVSRQRRSPAVQDRGYPASGRLGLCWSASIRRKTYAPQIACSLSDDGDTWSPPATPFADGGTQYLPAAAFEKERLWVAAYKSAGSRTRVQLAGSDDGRGFGAQIVLATRSFARSRICAPHPPDCTPPRQRLIGDYIGAVAVTGRVWVDFVLPVGGPGSAQRVYVATVATS